jgi:hypothetical protein
MYSSFSQKAKVSQHLVAQNFRFRNNFLENVNEDFHFLAKIWNFAKINVFQTWACPVLSVLSVYLSGRLVQSDLSLLFFPVFRSKISRPDPSVLSQLPYSRSPARVILTTALLTTLSCPGSPVISVLSILTCPGQPVHTVLSQLCRLSCPDRPVPAVLSRLSCPDCPVPAVLSPLSCPGCLVPAVLSGRSCPRCPISTATVVPTRSSCRNRPVLAVMFWPFWLYTYTIPSVFSGFSVAALLSRLTCPGFPVPTVLSRHPVPAVPF